MSIDINWDSLTSGPSGDALAESIRAFVHARFQTITLPRFIRSVNVHSFDLGSVAPEIEILDVCDPLPDFYQDSSDESSDDETTTTAADHPHSPTATTSHSPSSSATSTSTTGTATAPASTQPQSTHLPPPRPARTLSSLPQPHPLLAQAALAATPRASTPGIPGGTANLGYFHLPLGAGLSGTTTPLAAAAQFADLHALYAQRGARASWVHAPPSPPPPDSPGPAERGGRRRRSRSLSVEEDEGRARAGAGATDVQVAARLRYTGDVRLSLTAEILLDYPMPSFVALPLRLAVVGVAFDGVALVAHLEGNEQAGTDADGVAGPETHASKVKRRRVHFCFVAPEDAAALLEGVEGVQGSNGASGSGGGRGGGASEGEGSKIGGLLEEIKVESEIGAAGPGGRQALKNVGKVEKFVLEQVRRMFESEFVYPNYWTFLV